MFNLLSYAEKWHNKIGWWCVAFTYAGGWEMELLRGQLIKADVWPFDFWTPLHLVGLKCLRGDVGDVRVSDNLVKMKHFTDICCCYWSFNLSVGIFRGRCDIPPACPGSSCPLVPPVGNTVGLWALEESSRVSQEPQTFPGTVHPVARGRAASD